MMNTVIPQRKSKENPFFRMGASLTMLQSVSKLTDKPSRTAIFNYLNEAWKECKDALEKRQMFFSVVFSFGDITNREHNIFRAKAIKEPEAGGAGLRKVFLYCMEWMHLHVPEQFYRFLPIFGEYYNLGACSSALYTIWTDRWKGTVNEVHKIDVDIERLTDYIAGALKGAQSENELRLWAKWLWHIPGGKRKRKFTVTERGLKSVQKKYNADAKVGDVVTRVSDKQKETQAKDAFVLKCVASLSKKMNWKVTEFGKNVQYAGYREFRSKYLVDTEAVLFSTGKIRSFDKTQLLSWFDQLPGGARYRVQCRIVEKLPTGKLGAKSKWVTAKGLNIGEVFIEWMNGKETAQAELRKLTVEDKEKLAKEDPNKLKQMEQAAKFNMGGESLIDALMGMFTGAGTTQEANLKAQSLMDAMKVLVPVLIAADISGSTSGRPIKYNGVTFTPQAFIKLLTTVFLLKNPNPELADMFIRFDDKADVIAPGVSKEALAGNRFMATSMKNVDVLTDRTRDFVWNFNSVSQWIISRNATHFNVIADELKRWVDAGGELYRSMRIDMINKFPVFLCLSDGDLNYGTPASTILDFQAKMRQWFGWEGVVVIWDIKQADSEAAKFANLTNVVHYVGFNPSMVTQIFTNLHDLDIIDIYTTLESFYKSNRYQPVRDLVI